MERRDKEWDETPNQIRVRPDAATASIESTSSVISSMGTCHLINSGTVLVSNYSIYLSLYLSNFPTVILSVVKRSAEPKISHFDPAQAFFALLFSADIPFILHFIRTYIDPDVMFE